MTVSQGSVFADNDEKVLVDEPPAITIEDFIDDYERNGAHPDYKAFEARLGNAGGYDRAAGASIWEFIDDAVEGTGGFSTGAYIFPHSLELTPNGNPETKLLKRRAMADYDNFAGHIRNTPFDIISSCSDMIQRTATGQAKELLEELWADVDGRGQSMTDFLEYPHKQARNFTFGLIVVDRPREQLTSQKDNLRKDLRPRAYPVDTRSVVHWAFDSDGLQLAAIGILDVQTVDDGKERVQQTKMYVWTKTEWAVLINTGGDEKDLHEGPWEVIQGPKGPERGPNALREVPVVVVPNGVLSPGKLFGATEMVDVARAAQTTYNMDSEARETERKASMFLGIPVLSMESVPDTTVPIGLETAMAVPSGAGMPEWISPEYTILTHLADHKARIVAASYKMAGLTAIAASEGIVATSSGLHAEVEMHKTEVCIARHAGNLETAEKQLARIYLRWLGIEDAEYSITYPRDFGIRDLDKLLDRTERELNLSFGDTYDRDAIDTYIQAKKPRLDPKIRKKMVDEAIVARKAAAAELKAVERTKRLIAAVSPQQQQPGKMPMDEDEMDMPSGKMQPNMAAMRGANARRG